MKLIARPGRWLIILPPLLFLLVFFLIPFVFAFKISFADTAARVPPFTDVLTTTADHHLQFSLSLANYQYLFTDDVYGVAYLYSLKTAFFSTLICLLLVIILPFWTSFLLRVYALEASFATTAYSTPYCCTWD